jgi:hypothetical protein
VKIIIDFPSEQYVTLKLSRFTKENKKNKRRRRRKKETKCDERQTFTTGDSIN